MSKNLENLFEKEWQDAQEAIAKLESEQKEIEAAQQELATRTQNYYQQQLTAWTALQEQLEGLSGRVDERVRLLDDVIGSDKSEEFATAAAEPMNAEKRSEIEALVNKALFETNPVLSRAAGVLKTAKNKRASLLEIQQQIHDAQKELNKKIPALQAKLSTYEVEQEEKPETEAVSSEENSNTNNANILGMPPAVYLPLLGVGMFGLLAGSFYMQNLDNPDGPGFGLSDGSIYVETALGAQFYTAATDETEQLTLTYDQAVEVCSKSTKHRYDDWRVPNMDELEAMYEHRDTRALAGTFAQTGSNYESSYISLDVVGDDASQVKSKDFSTGAVALISRNDRRAVRCVRG